MPTNLPERKPPEASDKAWLFTKTILFLLISGLALLCGVVSAVWAGALAAMTTGSKLFGFMVCLATYASSMAGREWLHFKLVPRLFSTKDQNEMGKVIDGDKK
jgi:hypothetical protein